MSKTGECLPGVHQSLRLVCSSPDTWKTGIAILRLHSGLHYSPKSHLLTSVLGFEISTHKCGVMQAFNVYFTDALYCKVISNGKIQKASYRTVHFYINIDLMCIIYILPPCEMYVHSLLEICSKYQTTRKTVTNKHYYQRIQLLKRSEGHQIKVEAVGRLINSCIISAFCQKYYFQNSLPSSYFSKTQQLHLKQTL